MLKDWAGTIYADLDGKYDNYTIITLALRFNAIFLVQNQVPKP